MNTMTTPTMDRTAGIGGSDVPALLGISRWQSPLELYLEKTGQLDAQADNEATRWGTLLEDDVANEWARREGKRIRRVKRALTHPKHDWLVGHVDRKVTGERAILEVKCSSAKGWGEEGTDEVPDFVLAQTHTYMLLTDSEVAYVAALLWGGYGPPTLRRYTVHRDGDMDALIVDAGSRFWHDHVIPRVPPPPQTSAECSIRWRQATAGKTQVAFPADLAALEELAAVKVAQKDLAARRDELERALKSSLRDAEALVDTAGDVYATWKAQTSSRFDGAALREAEPEVYERYKATREYRVLRIKNRRTK